MNWKTEPITDGGMGALGSQYVMGAPGIHCWGEGIREVIISWQWSGRLRRKVIFVVSTSMIAFEHCKTLGDVAELYRMLTGRELEYEIKNRVVVATRRRGNTSAVSNYSGIAP